MFERLDDVVAEYEDVLAQLSDAAVIADQRRLRELSQRHHEIGPLVTVYRSYRDTQAEIVLAREMSADAEGQDRELLSNEISEAEERLASLEDELKLLLLPKDPNDGRNVIVEIRGAEGGEEANLFARDLYEMYLRYAERTGLKAEVLSSDASPKGGVNEVMLLVKGRDAWAHLKHEGGPHRVQRVPVTESQGRVHTSSATVTVLPEAQEVEVQIEEKDLRVDVYRSTGPGGQSVNTTDSAVRVTHLPTGIVVSMQAEQDRQTAELSTARRSQVGGGGRSEKIRTYNYKDNRVTDHRIGLTLHNLDKVLMGELDEIVDALLADERGRQLGGEDPV